jgi:hypothetical protein
MSTRGQVSPQTFIFRFGYCTPKQWKGNRAHGWDDESSGAFVIHADDAERALYWGCVVVTAFVTWLFKSIGEQEHAPWNDAEFANWIEEDPSAVFSAEQRRSLPTVMFGEMPEFSDWQ